MGMRYSPIIISLFFALRCVNFFSQPHRKINLTQRNKGIKKKIKDTTKIDNILSFPYTKLRENIIQNIISCFFARDFA